MNDQEIREAFAQELQGSSEAKTALVGKLSEQGIRLIEHRRKIMELIITVSGAVIATPAVFGIDVINKNLYQVGLGILIFNIIFTILHLRESLDTDEVQSVDTITMLLGVVERRIVKLKEYLVKSNLSDTDGREYYQYRQQEDYSDEMNSKQNANKKALANIVETKMNYPTAFITLLFTSGAFFIIASIIFPVIPIYTIIPIEMFLIGITSHNFATKVIYIYAKIINFIKQKI